MSNVHGLTTFDQLRGVLTVSVQDLPDETLSAYGLDDDLGVDLDAWTPGWESITDVAQARLLRLYAKYYCAATLAATAPVFVLTKASDGSNEGQRSDSEGFRWLAEAMMSKAMGFKAQLLVLLGGVVVAQETYSLISRVTPTRDPVVESRTSAS